ncbi:uncharacterized protein STEHIDRAFT_161029 [Stereum hirsutum FP-91666 SS1]|uniref:uncharacterized protein n=1 Tax=Stereum hirsutum (strain FP-91666) TaxID=721885 RepID=UPI000444A121|nr:uncharacterized protein STEHIDRAFT_161029 [Stereum hirsutum FP-91666 SS1]EIM82492.1 hypothetical protein STEHIDRAFT_161029 [Stereum hirsutum FP-91666 SS1]
MEDCDSSPRTSVFADFPNELWLRVFDFATLVPGALNFEYDDPFQPSAAYENTPLNFGPNRRSARRSAFSAHPNVPRNSNLTRKPTVRTANAVGLQIMLVCKRWRELFGTRLYRHLHIQSCRHLDDLAHKLALPPQDSVPGSNSRSLGSFVSRLDLVMKDLPWPGEEWEDVLSGIEKLFEHLPNLKILEISMRWEIIPDPFNDDHPSHWMRRPLEFWERIGSTCGHTLRRFECIPGRSNIFRLDNVDARDFFRIFPHIRTIGPADGDISLAEPKTRRFLELQGPLITTVYLTGSIVLSARDPPLSSLQVLGQYCPLLSRLIITTGDTFTLLYEPDALNYNRLCIIRHFPTTVTHLAIRYDEPQGRIELGQVVCWLAAPEIQSTSIRLVRLLKNEVEDYRTVIGLDGLPISSPPEPWPEEISPEELDSDEKLFADSPEDLFARVRGVPRRRFVGALRRLRAFGIRVEHADGREVEELDY